MQVIERPRWEDYEILYGGGEGEGGLGQAGKRFGGSGS